MRPCRAVAVPQARRETTGKWWTRGTQRARIQRESVCLSSRPAAVQRSRSLVRSAWGAAGPSWSWSWSWSWSGSGAGCPIAPRPPGSLRGDDGDVVIRISRTREAHENYCVAAQFDARLEETVDLKDHPWRASAATVSARSGIWPPHLPQRSSPVPARYQPLGAVLRPIPETLADVPVVVRIQAHRRFVERPGRPHTPPLRIDRTAAWGQAEHDETGHRLREQRSQLTVAAFGPCVASSPTPGSRWRASAPSSTRLPPPTPDLTRWRRGAAAAAGRESHPRYSTGTVTSSCEVPIRALPCGAACSYARFAFAGGPRRAYCMLSARRCRRPYRRRSVSLIPPQVPYGSGAAGA